MTKSAVPEANVLTAVREPRPFLFLEPARLPLRNGALDREGVAFLHAAAEAWVPMLVRSLVQFTIARQNRRELERGRAQSPRRGCRRSARPAPTSGPRPAPCAN